MSVAVVAAVTAACGETPEQSAPATPEEGRDVAEELGCFSCHSTDGSRRVGPTWQGLWGSEVELADGTTVTADEEYIRTSILDPDAQQVAGFGVMPDFDVSESELEALVAYIRSLE